MTARCVFPLTADGTMAGPIARFAAQAAVVKAAA